MKKYIYIITIITICGLFFSCNEQLDLDTDGRITRDEIFKERNKVRGFLNSCYDASFCPAPYMDRSSFTDEAHDCDAITAGSVYSQWYVGAVTGVNYGSVSADSDPWGGLYQGIRKCNIFIANIKTSTALISDEERAGWEAQARTLRALYYLQLIKRYGDVPLFTEDLGVNHDFTTDKKASFSEVVTFIINECKVALSVPDSKDGFSWNIYDNQHGIMHRAIPYAIMSQAVVYAASPLWSDGTYTWKDATEITKEALSQCLTHDYKLFDVVPESTEAQNAYALYFLTNSNDRRSVDKETIYQKGGTMAVWEHAGLPSTPNMSKSGPCPTQELVDSYEMLATGEAPILGYSDDKHLSPIVNTASGYDPNNPYEGRDPRFYASIYYNGAIRYLDQPNGKKVESYVGGAEGISSTDRRHTRTGYYMRKFNYHRSGLNNNNDGAIRMFRLAELYLNFAEAAYQSDGPDAVIDLGSGIKMSAREAVNAVRERAGMPGFPSGMSVADFEKKYRNERRVEFAFEEHRFFDVRRWKILDQTDKYLTGMEISKEGTGYTYKRFAFSERLCSTSKFLKYPINQDEIDKITGYTQQDWQNEGW